MKTNWQENWTELRLQGHSRPWNQVWENLNDYIWWQLKDPIKDQLWEQFCEN
jgi:hypothetical protein